MLESHVPPKIRQRTDRQAGFVMKFQSTGAGGPCMKRRTISPSRDNLDPLRNSISGTAVKEPGLRRRTKQLVTELEKQSELLERPLALSLGLDPKTILTVRPPKTASPGISLFHESLAELVRHDKYIKQGCFCPFNSVIQGHTH